VIDYARTFGLPAVVFRMSCIYGPHQMGNEDQGWVAHFLICALEDRPLTVYGDGMQVRDVLYVDDLVDAFFAARSNMRNISGQAFNMGGGPARAVSLLELIDMIVDLHGEAPACESSDWRAGDQRYYVSDTRKFQEATGWTARVDPQEGVQRLYEWLRRTHGWNKSALSAGLATARSDVKPLCEVAWRHKIGKNDRWEKRCRRFNHEPGEAYRQNHARRANRCAQAGRD
jgi:CDP-paratose 2-epimerase